MKIYMDSLGQTKFHDQQSKFYDRDGNLIITEKQLKNAKSHKFNLSKDH